MAYKRDAYVINNINFALRERCLVVGLAQFVLEQLDLGATRGSVLFVLLFEACLLDEFVVEVLDMFLCVCHINKIKHPYS